VIKHDPNDSLHRLAIDLRRQLNLRQTEMAEETLDGAAAYGLAQTDRPLVAAFMAGINRTAQPKFARTDLAITAHGPQRAPELLPMIITVTLARSAMQMAKRKVIVKRLSAIHDIGAMNVPCTDKTGTLTEAKIMLLRTIDGRGADSAVAFS